MEQVLIFSPSQFPCPDQGRHADNRYSQTLSPRQPDKGPFYRFEEARSCSGKSEGDCHRGQRQTGLDP
jgi:hypothetical protein